MKLKLNLLKLRNNEISSLEAIIVDWNNRLEDLVNPDPVTEDLPGQANENQQSSESKDELEDSTSLLDSKDESQLELIEEKSFEGTSKIVEADPVFEINLELGIKEDPHLKELQEQYAPHFQTLNKFKEAEIVSVYLKHEVMTAIKEILLICKNEPSHFNIEATQSFINGLKEDKLDLLNLFYSKFPKDHLVRALLNTKVKKDPLVEKEKNKKELKDLMQKFVELSPEEIRNSEIFSKTVLSIYNQCYEPDCVEMIKDFLSNLSDEKFDLLLSQTFCRDFEYSLFRVLNDEKKEKLSKEKNQLLIPHIEVIKEFLKDDNGNKTAEDVVKALKEIIDIMEKNTHIKFDDARKLILSIPENSYKQYVLITEIFKNRLYNWNFFSPNMITLLNKRKEEAIDKSFRILDQLKLPLADQASLKTMLDALHELSLHHLGFSSYRLRQFYFKLNAQDLSLLAKAKSDGHTPFVLPEFPATPFEVKSGSSGVINNYSVEEWKKFIVFYGELSNSSNFSSQLWNRLISKSSENLDAFLQAFAEVELSEAGRSKIHEAIKNTQNISVDIKILDKESLNNTLEKIQRIERIVHHFGAPFPVEYLQKKILPWLHSLTSDNRLQLLEMLPKEMELTDIVSQLNNATYPDYEEHKARWKEEVLEITDNFDKNILYAIGKDNLAKLLNEISQDNALTHNEIQIAFRRVINAYPFLEKFLIKVEDSNNLVLSIESVDIVLKAWKKKEKNKDLEFNYHLCDSLSGFEASFNEFRNSDDKIGYFVVKPDAGSVHLTPICIKKNEDGSYTVINTDSIGGSRFYQPIFDQLKQMKVKGQFYCTDFVRQRDATNCPIFTMRDLMKIAKNPDYYFNYIEKNAKKPSYDDFAMYKVHTLPANLMLPLQFNEAAKNYLTDAKKNDKEEEAVIQKLESKFGKYKKAAINEEGSLKEQNTYAVNRFLRHQNNIAAQALAEELKLSI